MQEANGQDDPLDIVGQKKANPVGSGIDVPDPHIKSRSEDIRTIKKVQLTNFSYTLALTQKNGLTFLRIKNVAPTGIFLKLLSLFGKSTQYTGTKNHTCLMCFQKYDSLETLKTHVVHLVQPQ